MGEGEGAGKGGGGLLHDFRKRKLLLNLNHFLTFSGKFVPKRSIHQIWIEK